MTQYTKRIHIIPTSLDEDRLEGLFEIQPDQVYILYNNDPMKEHESVAEETKRMAYQIAKKHTKKENINQIGVDFYHFEEALIDVYRILYEEKINENKVFVNVSGGTKPVAIALAFACSLTDIGEPFYYAAEEYSTENEVIKTQGMIEDSFELSQLTSLDISSTIPDDEEKRDIVQWLLQAQDWSGITELLERETSKLDEVNDNDARRSITNPYYSHANSLVESGLINKKNSKYKLTESGKLVGELLEVQQSINEKQ